MAFESKDIAQKRVMSAGKRKRNPVGDLTNMTWDKESMKAEVMRYPAGTLVNWTDLARQYNILNKSGELAKNGGQIAQEWLKSAGVDVHKLKRLNTENDTCRIRRKKLRGAGGEISVATLPTIDFVKEEMKKKSFVRRILGWTTHCTAKGMVQ